MGAMTVSTGLPFGRALTVDDLASMPDDGHRYELLDGTLLVSPAPSWAHQLVTLALAKMLDDRCPLGWRALTAPFDVTFGRRDTALQPDVLVARYEDFTHANLPTAPSLAVEVLSQSTALVDRNLKKAAYEHFGVESYWIVDPTVRTLVAFELREGNYVPIATLGSNGSYDFERPFPISVSMRDVCRRLDPD